MRGIANAARNLNASIQNDTLIITRLGYDFEKGEEREEPFVKIPLVQIQSLADVLAVDYMYAEMMLASSDFGPSWPEAVMPGLLKNSASSAGVSFRERTA